MSKERLIQQANKIALDSEQEWAIDKIEESHQAKRASEQCKCLQCINWYQRTQEQMETEAFRLSNYPEIDHEEQWVRDTQGLRDTFDKLDRDKLRKSGLL